MKIRKFPSKEKAREIKSNNEVLDKPKLILYRKLESSHHPDVEVTITKDTDWGNSDKEQTYWFHMTVSTSDNGTGHKFRNLSSLEVKEKVKIKLQKELDDYTNSFQKLIDSI